MKQGLAEKILSGFAAKGKRKKNQGNTSRAQRNPTTSTQRPGGSLSRNEARRPAESTYHEPPRRTRPFFESSYQSSTRSHTLPARSAIPSGVEPRGKSPTGLTRSSFVSL